MKKTILSLATFMTMSAVASFASGKWTLQGNEYRVDTLFHAYVGPGTTQTSLKLSGPSNLRVFYTTTDLTDTNVDVRGIKSGDKIVSVSTVSDMAISHSSASRSYFAGVNADFFGGSAPCGATIIDGEVLNFPPGTSWEHFVIDKNRKPYVADQLDMAVSLSGSFGTQAVSAINEGRGQDQLIIYTSPYGSSTGTNSYGTEVMVKPIDGNVKIAAGTSVKVKVVGTPTAGVGNMAIPADGIVLSGHGTSASFVGSLTDGQELTLSTTFALDGTPVSDVMQVLGGRPLIVKNGEVLNTESVLDHLVSNNPRTAVGYDASRTKLVMLVVDGRSTTSAGVVSKVLADMMIYTGCSDAMNFDGGGSSALYIKDLGVRNNPSDGKERSVTNGLFLATDAPADSEIAQIRFTDAAKALPKYGYYTPVFFGYNKYGVLVNQDVKGVKLSCDAALGEVGSDGATLFCNGSGCHALTATLNGMTATIPVTIGSAEPEFRFSKIVEDGLHGYDMEVRALVDEQYLPIANEALTWWSDDNAVASVDANGRILGVANGSTTIHGKTGDIEHSITVDVQKPTARVARADSGEFDAASWNVTQTGGTGGTITALGDGINYQYTGKSGRSPYIKISKNITFWSIPDSLRLTINPGEAKVSKITFTLKNAAGEAGNYVVEGITANADNIIRVPITEVLGEGDRSIYPVSLSSIYFSMGTSTTGTVYNIAMPEIALIYDRFATSRVDATGTEKAAIAIYPNPIAQGEPVNVALMNDGSATIEVFDLAGCLQFTATATADAPTFSSAALAEGVYVVNITDENGAKSTAKLIVK